MTGTAPWPATAVVEGRSVTSIGGVDLAGLAESHGTPLWVVDEADLRMRCRAYRRAFPEVAYASKAWCTVGILRIVADEGLWVDVASGGELYTAERAGVPMERVVFHGNNKSEAELRMAAGLGVGRLVIDSFDEIGLADRVGAATGHRFRAWIRVTPGIDAHTHAFVRTGHDDSKFGFTLSLGLADRALERALASDHLAVAGVHAHIGSQIFGAAPLAANTEVLIGVLAGWRDRYGVTLDELNVGGGMAIPYTHEDRPLGPAGYGAVLSGALTAEAARLGFPVPRLFVEPGRALVGPSAATLYRVGTVKRIPGIRTYAAVDGGMSDNIRPALYGAEHEVAPAGRRSDAPLEAMTIVGKHCESGDLVREHAPLPSDLAPGDLLVVAATGAYTESMASTYNRVPRPGAVLVQDGSARWMVRPETYEDLVARDLPAGPAAADG